METALSGTVSQPAAGVTPRLAVSHVSYNYGAVPAVQDFSLVLAAGEFVCLLGPSGCGKSTALRLIAGLELPAHGQIFINGVEVAGPGVFVPPEHRNVGLMFQDFALFPHLTVLQNVTFGLTHLPKAVRAEVAIAALESVGMARSAPLYPHTLSGGEQQRVALARALAPRPSIMLLDEPFSGLDRHMREEVREHTVAALASSGAAVLIVTHDPEEAMLLGNRIAMMRAGRLVQIGPPEQLYFHPADAEVAEFFSNINRFHGIVKAGCVETPFGKITAPGVGDGAGAEIFVRPEQLQLCPSSSANSAMARVVRSIPLGPDRILELDLEEGNVRLRARVPLHAAPALGTATGVRIDPAAALVFPCRCGNEGKAASHA